LKSGKEPPCLPIATAASFTEERTYKNLLGPLGDECTVWAECQFVDPIADIAVLSEPDNQGLSKEAEAYNQLVEAMPVLPIGKAPAQEFERIPRSKNFGGIRNPVPSPGHAQVLTLNGQWRRYAVHRDGGSLYFGEEFEPGMSGSPILNDDGAAVGVVVTEHMNPVIWDRLPAGLLRTLIKATP
jgi:hypothetical protein